jgi:hypothetical protein
MHYDLSEACMAHTKLETRGVMPIDMRILSWVWWVGLGNTYIDGTIYKCYLCQIST